MSNDHGADERAPLLRRRDARDSSWTTPWFIARAIASIAVIALCVVNTPTLARVAGLGEDETCVKAGELIETNEITVEEIKKIVTEVLDAGEETAAGTKKTAVDALLRDGFFCDAEARERTASAFWDEFTLTGVLNAANGYPEKCDAYLETEQPESAPRKKCDVSDVKTTDATKVSGKKKILVIGDSMGEFSGLELQNYCGNTEVYNLAVGGSVAYQWGSKDLKHPGPEGEVPTYYGDYKSVKKCTMDKTFDAVWVSIGGNDLMGSTGCYVSPKEMAARVEDVITNAKKPGHLKLSPGAKFIIIGYCQSVEKPAPACLKPNNFGALSEAFKLVAERNDDVIFHDSLTLCGGGIDTYSPKGYHQDTVHLNRRGYCKIFTQGVVQSAFQCAPRTGAAVNCDLEVTPGSQQCKVRGLDPKERCQNTGSGPTPHRDGADPIDHPVYPKADIEYTCKKV